MRGQPVMGLPPWPKSRTPTGRGTVRLLASSVAGRGDPDPLVLAAVVVAGDNLGFRRTVGEVRAPPEREGDTGSGPTTESEGAPGFLRLHSRSAVCATADAG